LVDPLEALVDQLVTSNNANRSDEVWAQRQALLNAVSCWTMRMSQLRQFFSWWQINSNVVEKMLKTKSNMMKKMTGYGSPGKITCR
jgi:hypothetical protein